MFSFFFFLHEPLTLLYARNSSILYGAVHNPIDFSRLPRSVDQSGQSIFGMKCGLCTVGPSIFHMSAQQKKAASGPCFRISYYQSNQIIQKTCCCILHSFTCLAHWTKKIENWSVTTIFHIPCLQDAFHSSV